MTSDNRRSLLLTLRFDGTNYHGWQVQQNAVTVQQTLQNAIEAVFGVREGVVGCSRTDAGVHAEMFCVGFKTDSSMDCEQIIKALNFHLPCDIGVYACREVSAKFHPRYSCVTKRYVYRIWNSPHKNPFTRERYMHYPYPLDADSLHEVSQSFVGTHDFCGFASSGHSVEDTVRTVKAFNVTRCGDEVFFRVEADGFLYNMVRIMVGTLLDIAAGKIAASDLPQIILSGERANAGKTAPACGLYLERVNYPNDID